MAESTYDTDYGIGDRVIIDDDRSIVGRVTAISIRTAMVNYEVSYFHCGVSYCPMIEGRRLKGV